MEYNEVYGWMPQEVINHLSEIDRQKMFLNWVLRKPSEAGWIIVKSTLSFLGNPFIEWMLKGVMESLELDETPVTKENLTEGLSTLISGFASDANSLMEYVNNYLEENPGASEEEVPTKKLKRDSKGRFTK